MKVTVCRKVVGIVFLLHVVCGLTTSCRPTAQRQEALSNTPKLEKPLGRPADDLKANVYIEVSVKTLRGGRPVIQGITNLPDGTEGVAAVESKAANFRGQEKFSVADSVFLV